MSQHTLRKLFILTLILTYLTNSTAALAGSCGDIAGDPSCDNICQCAEDKFSSVSQNSQGGTKNSKQPQGCTESATDSKSCLKTATALSGIDGVVQLKTYCDAWKAAKDVIPRLQLERDLAISASVLCFSAFAAAIFAIAVCANVVTVIGCPAAKKIAVVMGATCSSLVASVGGIEARDFKALQDRQEKIIDDYSFLNKSLDDILSGTSTVKSLEGAIGLAVGGSIAAAVPVVGPLTLGITMAVEAEKKRTGKNSVEGLPNETCNGPIRSIATNALGILLPNNAPGARSGQTGSNSGKSGAKGGAGTSLENKSNNSGDPVGDSLQLGQSNATAYDDLNKINGTKLNPQDIDKALKEHLNTSLAELHNQLESGKTTSQVIGNTVPNLPSEIKDGLADMEQHPEKYPKNPWSDFFGDKASIMTGGAGGGGGGGGGGGSDPFASMMNFGRSDGDVAGGGKTSEMNFNGRKVASSEVQDGDIFHSKWKGSIFSIISFRISKVTHELAQLEWAGMFNRAMHGLPPLNTPASKLGDSRLKGLTPSPSPSVRPAPITPEFIERK